MERTSKMDRKIEQLYQRLKDKKMMLTEKETLMYLLWAYEANKIRLSSLKKQMYDLNQLLQVINNDEQKTSLYRRYKRVFLHFKKLEFMTRTYADNFFYLLNEHLKCDVLLKQAISFFYEELKDNMAILQQDTNAVIEETETLVSYVIGYRNTNKMLLSEYEKSKKAETFYYKSVMLDKQDDFKRYGELRRKLIAVNKELQEANQKWINSVMKINHADDILRYFYAE